MFRDGTSELGRDGLLRGDPSSRRSCCINPGLRASPDRARRTKIARGIRGARRTCRIGGSARQAGFKDDTAVFVDEIERVHVRRCPSRVDDRTACSRPCSSRTSSASTEQPRRSETRGGVEMLDRARTRRRAADLDALPRPAWCPREGDGSLTTFDGPARAIRCATRDPRRRRSRSASTSAAGLHTGEVERPTGADRTASPCTSALAVARPRGSR